MTVHGNLKHAIREAMTCVPCGIAYIQGKGWAVYDPTQPIAGAAPEFFCATTGRLPVALSEDAAASLLSLLI